MRDEFETKDNQLIGITSELERLREDQYLLKGEVKDRGSAIVTLQTELEKVRGEVVEKEQAIANLKTELAAKGEVKQLSFFPPEPTQPTAPEPEPEPEPTPEPEPEPNTDNPVIESSPVTVTSELVTVGTPGLLDYINLVDPKSGVTKDGFDNAMTRHLGAIKNGKTPPQGEKSIPFLEAKYSFKCLGKNGKYHQFSILKP